MSRSSFRILAVVGLAAVAGSIALAQPTKDSKPAPAAPAKKPAGAQPEPALPPGWTDADMQACMEAGTPGPMHEHLAKSAGVWSGKTTMWMGPGAEPTKSECTSTITSMMDGRFTKCEMAGDMPGMGPFNGFGIYGFDNVSQKFQATWVDNYGTGMMIGTGELSSDGNTTTWRYTYNCPITKKPTPMREIERITGKDTKTMEMFCIDPKSGKEYKMLEIAFTRTSKGGKPLANRTVEVGCGNCVFSMAGVDGCKLAVKLDGKAYLVDGAGVDAHDFCSGSKQAVVSGNIEGDRFIASKFAVKPETR